VIDAMIADAFDGPTILKNLDSLRDAIGDAANDDSARLTRECTQNKLHRVLTALPTP
jgi:hypothetical protein